MNAIDSTRNAMERAGETVRGLRSNVNDLAGRGMSTAAESAVAAQRYLGEYRQATTRYVGEHPLKSALIAAAVGAAVAGIVIALRRHRSSEY